MSQVNKESHLGLPIQDQTKNPICCYIYLVSSMEFNTDHNFDINDFKHDSLLFTEEGINRYCPGVLHPVSIGDKFHGRRYTVHHKLGFGESATVWLATDDIYGASFVES